MAAKTPKGRSGNTGTTGGLTEKDMKDLSQQGRAAESLLSNKTLDKALNEMRENAFEWFITTDLNETEIREEIHRFVRTIDNFRGVLKTYVNKGSNAQKKLEVLHNGGKRT